MERAAPLIPRILLQLLLFVIGVYKSYQLLQICYFSLTLIPLLIIKQSYYGFTWLLETTQ